MGIATAAEVGTPNEDFPPIVKGASFMLAWRLEGRRVLLIGGGVVASGRLYYLLESGAHVTIVSPLSTLDPSVHHRIHVSNIDDITYHPRKYLGANDPLPVTDYDMVLTAIDNNALSREICALCRQKKIPVNVADVPPECDFYFGSQLRRGPLQIMVSTNGNGPKIAVLIKNQIEANLPGDVEVAIEGVGNLRKDLRKRAPGVGGPLGQKRMDWMIKTCDAWPLGEMGKLRDEAIRTRLLDDGWDKGKIISAKDVNGQGGWLGGMGLGDIAGRALGAGIGGFVGGAAIATLATIYWTRHLSK
ncbi:precorrin-2 dehydrogenase / sirohydrochlorin ferrochelatase, partial [Tremellales sp. Uapishka_1]